MNQAENNPLARNHNTLSLLKFAFPSILMMLFMGLYTAVDTVFVARFVGANALAAINIVCPVINLIVGLGTMLATGAGAIIARKMGCRKQSEANRNLSLTLLTGAGIGLLITVFGLLFLDRIISGLGASEILFPYCRDYLTVQLFCAVLNLLQVLYQNLLVTAGRPSLGLLLCLLAGIANIVFDYIFIVLFRMGIRGAAIGTGLGYLIPALGGTLFFLFGQTQLHFGRPRIDLCFLGKSCSNGASEMVSQIAAAVTTFLFNTAMMRLLGEDGVAAITVIIYSNFLLTALFIGFCMGTAPIISYSCGSRNTRQLRKTVRICFRFIAAVSGFIFLLSFLTGGKTAAVFVRNNAHVLSITQTGFSIFSFGFLFSGCNIFSSALFTALSNGKISAVISFSRTFGFLAVFLLALPQFFQVTGVWLAIPLAELCTFLPTICLVLRHRKDYGY